MVIYGTCADILNNPANCGGCGISAGPGNACVSGVPQQALSQYRNRYRLSEQSARVRPHCQANLSNPGQAAASAAGFCLRGRVCGRGSGLCRRRLPARRLRVVSARHARNCGVCPQDVKTQCSQLVASSFAGEIGEALTACNSVCQIQHRQPVNSACIQP